MTLRYEPAHLTRRVTVVQGCAVGTATRADAYANWFVRDHGTKRLTASTPRAPAPRLPLRKLDEGF